MNRSVGMSIVALVIAAAGCDTMTGVGVPIPIARFRADAHSFASFSGMNAPARLVIRDADSWQAAWTQINGGSSAAPLPSINFSREMVILAAMGTQGSSGPDILITGASQADAGGAVIAIRLTSVGVGCASLTILTQPVDLARMPRRDGEVTFVEHSEVIHC
jgi:hypothetical protein